MMALSETERKGWVAGTLQGLGGAFRVVDGLLPLD